jgi:HNH endonuclease
MRPTQKALVARGLDLDCASRLADDGWTLNKLKLASKLELEAAGLDEAFIEALFKEARPPIPNDVLMSVLFANRYQCCICRNPKLSVIVHHIEEWADGRSHDIDNLAVLCLHHHDQAHSKKSLSKTLDANTLREAKAKWEAEVKRFDAESILEALRLDYSNWNFINELRVFEIANALKLDLRQTRYFANARAKGVVSASGLPIPVENDRLFYMYQGPAIIDRYLYVAGVFAKVIERLPIINVSDYLDKGVLKFALAPGDFIFVQGAHVFSRTREWKSGPGRGQFCEGVRRANKVEVRFVFDRWEATSSSALNCWLVGTRNQGSLVHVKDLARENGRLVIRGTVLGICSNIGDLKKRDYASSLQ